MYVCASVCLCVCARAGGGRTLSSESSHESRRMCAKCLTAVLCNSTGQVLYYMTARTGLEWHWRRRISEDQNRTSLSSSSTVSIRTFWTCYHSTGITLTISPCVDTSPDRRGFAQFPTDQIMTHFTLLGWVFPSILFALILDHNTNC